MKVFNPLKCGADDFAIIESDQILVSAVAYDVILDPYPWIVGGATITNDLRFSVLTNDEGNVLAGSL
jgi:hypothetical protein